MNKEDAHIVIAMANHNMNVTDVASTDSGGSLWYDFLEKLGYYVPYEK